MTTRFPILIFVLLAAPAFAHLVPINPSTCALDVRLAAPAAGIDAVVDPPAAGDLVRTSYEPDANPTRSQMQVCPADPVDPSERCVVAFPARAFTVNGVAGSITLPSAFAFRLLANGDLHATDVPVSIAFGGSGPVTVPFELATGLVLVGTPVLGTPIDASGAFTVVGAGAGGTLPAPLGGVALELTLGCTLAPAPDLDQFALPARLDKVRGTLTTKKVKLTMVIESDVTMPADFGGLPTILRLAEGDASVLDGVSTLAAGARGRFASASGDLVVSPLRSRTSRLMKVVLKRSIATASTFTSGDGTMALSSGGLMASRSVSLKATHHGTRLVVHER